MVPIHWTLGLLVLAAFVFELYRLDRHWKINHDFTLRERISYFLRFSTGPISNPILQVLAEDSKTPDVKWDLERDVLNTQRTELEEKAAKLVPLRAMVVAKKKRIPDADKFLHRIDSVLETIEKDWKTNVNRTLFLTAGIEHERKRDGLDPEWADGRESHD